MFDLSGHHDLRNTFGPADLNQLTQFAERPPVPSFRNALDILRRFFFNRDGNCFIALLARRLQSYHGEAAITGNDAVFHPLITPRCDAEMNASNSSISGHGSASACIRSIAWLVFNPARVKR